MNNYIPFLWNVLYILIILIIIIILIFICTQ